MASSLECLDKNGYLGFQHLRSEFSDLEDFRKQHLIFRCLLLLIQYPQRQINNSQWQIGQWGLSWKWSTSERSSSRGGWRRSWPTITHFQILRNMKLLFFILSNLFNEFLDKADASPDSLNRSHSVLDKFAFDIISTILGQINLVAPLQKTYFKNLVWTFSRPSNCKRARPRETIRLICRILKCQIF